MGRKSMVVNFFTDADWFTFSPAEMVNFLAAINKIQLSNYFHSIFQCL